MTEKQGSVDDPDPRTAPKPTPGGLPPGQSRDLPADPAVGDRGKSDETTSEPPVYAPGEDPYEQAEHP